MITPCDLRLWFCSVFPLAVLATAGSAWSSGWDSIVDRYQATLARIQTLEVEYETHKSSEGGPDPSTDHNYWLREGTMRQRLRRTAKLAQPPTNQLIQITSDTLFVGSTRYYASKIDSPGGPALVGNILHFKNDEERKQCFLRDSTASEQLLLSHEVLASCEPKRSMRELLAESELVFGKGAVRVEQETVGVYPCWKITYKHPGCVASGRVALRAAEVSIYFDPSVNYMIRKSVFQGKIYQEDVHQIRIVQEVRAFVDCGGGVFFPNEVSFGTDTAGGSFNAVHRVRKVSINQPIADTAWRFQFPEGTVVTELHSLPRGPLHHYAPEDRMHVVGPKGEFIRTFGPGSAEHYQYQTETFQIRQLEAKQRRTHLALFAIGILLLVLVGSLVGTFYLRRQPK